MWFQFAVFLRLPLLSEQQSRMFFFFKYITSTEPIQYCPSRTLPTTRNIYFISRLNYIRDENRTDAGFAVCATNKSAGRQTQTAKPASNQPLNRPAGKLFRQYVYPSCLLLVLQAVH